MSEDGIFSCDVQDYPWKKHIWYHKIRPMWESYLSPREWYYRIKQYHQRGIRGWSDRDTWSLDWYLAPVISQSVQSILNVDQGYFHFCPKDVSHKWKTDLPDELAWNKDAGIPRWHCQQCEKEYLDKEIELGYKQHLRDIIESFKEWRYLEEHSIIKSEDHDRLQPKMMKFIYMFGSLWT